MIFAAIPAKGVKISRIMVTAASLMMTTGSPSSSKVTVSIQIFLGPKAARIANYVADDSVGDLEEEDPLALEERLNEILSGSNICRWIV